MTRPLLPTEAGDGRLRHTTPRDAAERRRRLILAVDLAFRLDRRPGFDGRVDHASARQFLRAEIDALEAHLDAETAIGGAA